MQDKTPRLLRFLIRGLQGFVMMLEEDREVRESMDPTTLENFLHWRERLGRLDMTRPVDGQTPAKEPAKPRRRKVD